MAKCRNCSSAQTKFLFTKGNFTIYRCFSCGIVFSDKAYLRSQIQEVYSDEYYENLKNFSQITDQRYAAILSHLSLHKKKGRLLDLGCGTGQFLLAAKKNGWDAIGVEVSKDISQWAKDNFALDIRCGEFIEMDSDRDYFDAVTMFESLEHLNSPVAYLNRINLILKKGGMLFLTTPNFSSLSRRLIGRNWRVFSREHLFYFSPQTLKRFLEDNGFKIVECITKNFSFTELKNSILRYNDKKNFKAEEEKLREKIECSEALKLAKNIINKCLNLWKMGDSIWVFAEKFR